MIETSIRKIKKRDGRITDFDQNKITDAIWKASLEVGKKDRPLAERFSDEVVSRLNKIFYKKVPSVEDVQDIVEDVLISNGESRIAKAYILYRQKRAEIREEKKRILEKDEIDDIDKKFDTNALRVLKVRYLRKDEEGHLIEGPKELFTRVATHVALPELLYDPLVFARGKGKKHAKEIFEPEKEEDKYSIGQFKLNRYHLEALKRMYDRANESLDLNVSWSEFLRYLKEGKFDKYEHVIKEFFDIMVDKNFMPNTPAIVNFGNPLGMGSACFVLDIEDSLESIMGTLKKAAIIFKSGGGVGYNFSKLRPKGDFITGTSGVSSGPVTFMRLYDVMTEVVKQGGVRRGANLGILSIDHPDIEEFVTSKIGNKALRNFNISVLIKPEFWEHYVANKPYPLKSPRTGEVVRTINPRVLFDKIVYQAWESGEPGIIFYDHVNKYNPFYESLGPIVATNPCGEVLLYPNESCNLGSINVWAFVKEGKYDWEGLRRAVYAGVRFLDNVIDVNNFPSTEIEKMTLATRKIGLGIMGLANLLFELGLPYNSKQGREFMSRLMEFINYHSKIASIELAKERVAFPYFEKSFYPKGRMPFSGFYYRKHWKMNWEKVLEGIKKYGLRNAYTTVIPPTGSVSMIAGCSSGIEPQYSFVFEKHVKIGSYYYVDPVFERIIRFEGLYDENLIKDVNRNNGSIANINYIPQKWKSIFVTAMDMSPEDHIKALAAFQRWVDSSISKTNNLPANSTIEDIKNSYLLAYKLGCKDVTVYRDTSIKGQVLVSGEKEKQEKILLETEKVSPTYPVKKNLVYNLEEIKRSGICPECGSNLAYKEGCFSCLECGWGICL